jgi:hypothetical protein
VIVELKSLVAAEVVRDCVVSLVRRSERFLSPKAAKATFPARSAGISVLVAGHRCQRVSASVTVVVALAKDCAAIVVVNWD